jgi:hypothetical protein
MEVDRWSHAYPPHHVLDLTPLVETGGDVDGAVTEAVTNALTSG